MPLLDGHRNYGDDENSSRNRLAEEALVLSAGLLAGYTLMHKPNMALAEEMVPEMKAVGRNALDSAGKYLGLTAEQSLGVAGSGFKSLAADTAGSAEIVPETKAIISELGGDVNKGASKLAANIELGANPAPQFAARHQDLETKYLGFTRKWPVEGVQINDQGVNLVVTNNGHWVKMTGFEKPSAEVHGLDILNTWVTNVGTATEKTAAGDVQMTRIELARGKMDPVVLKGPAKAVEFWYK